MATYRVPSPYFSTQAGADIGTGIGNLATAMFGDPMRAGQLAYQKAEAERAAAETGVANQRMRLLQQQGAAPGMVRSALSDAIVGPLATPRPDPSFVGPMPSMTRRQKITEAIPALAEALSQSDPAAVGQLGKLIGVALANTGAPDEAIIRNNAGQGVYIGKDDAASLSGQDAIRAGNFGQETKLEGMRQGGANSRNAADIAERRWAEIFSQDAETKRDTARTGAALTRQNALPVNTPAGTTTTFAPGDQRAPGGSVVGMPTESTTLGQVLGDYAAGKPQTAQGRELARAKGGITAGENKRAIDFKDLGSVDEEINSQLGIKFDSKTGAMVDGSQPDLPPELRAPVRADAIAFYQGGDDPPTAVQKAIAKNIKVTPGDANFWSRISVGTIGGSRDRTYGSAQPSTGSLPDTGSQGTATPPAASDGVDFATAGRAEAIKAKVKAGTITREQALKELKALGFGD